jgi:hypothetical protein
MTHSENKMNIFAKALLERRGKDKGRERLMAAIVPEERKRLSEMIDDVETRLLALQNAQLTASCRGNPLLHKDDNR